MTRLKHVAILCVSLWLLLALTVASTETFVSIGYSQHQVAETDLNRVDWKLNHISNPGFELWTTPHVIDDVYTTRTTEHYGWYAQSPWPVNEGLRSRGMQTRAVDPDHPAEERLTRGTWISWNNPVNLTLKFDWYIDQIPEPVDSDYFRLVVELDAPGTHRMYYYFGSSDTTRTNSTYYQYFFIDGPVQTWNTFDRNITEDFFEIAGYYPTEFRLFNFYLRSYSSDYSRVFLDDLWMTNNTVFIGGSTENGNFESGGSWYSFSGDSAADISQSSTNQEGDWSLNVTADSNGNESEAEVRWSPDRRISAANPDTFSFQWMLDEYTVATEDTYAYMYVNCWNGTEEFYLMYVFCYGIDTTEFLYEGMNLINVTEFNITGQWNTFSRSIWSDVSSVNQTDFIVIDEIELVVYTREQGARITLLIDDMSLESAAMDDMGYEDHGDVGDPVFTWGANSAPYSEFTITDVAHSGAKAGNLTVTDSNSWSEGVDFENRLINDNTDLWFDFYWMIENDTADIDNMMYLEVYFTSGESLAYIFVNHTPVPSENGFDEAIFLPEANTVGVWNNFHRNLFDDFTTTFGSEPATEIEEFYLVIEADTGGKLSVLFDDVYLYEDPSPEISGIQTTTPMPNRDVNVTAIVEDLSSFSVNLYYKVEDGAWNEVAMVDTGNGFNATIPGQPSGFQVTFYIEAIDTFNQISQTSEITYLIPSDPDPTPTDGNLLPVFIGVGVLVAIIGIIVVYYFIIRPRQSAD